MYSTEQEKFWAGEFGEEYTGRNTEDTMQARINLFKKALPNDIGSLYEIGANRGLNMEAIHKINPALKLFAVEINEVAYQVLSQKEYVTAAHGTFLGKDHFKADLAMSSGVLIHINPDALDQAYEHLYNAANKYILVSEYYSPSPVEITYRGHEGRLFKRDFAGEMMEKYNLTLVDYGFVYRRDPEPLDDVTWFLLKK